MLLQREDEAAADHAVRPAEDARVLVVVGVERLAEALYEQLDGLVAAVDAHEAVDALLADALDVADQPEREDEVLVLVLHGDVHAVVRVVHAHAGAHDDAVERAHAEEVLLGDVQAAHAADPLDDREDLAGLLRGKELEHAVDGNVDLVDVGDLGLQPQGVGVGVLALLLEEEVVRGRVADGLAREDVLQREVRGRELALVEGEGGHTSARAGRDARVESIFDALGHQELHHALEHGLVLVLVLLAERLAARGDGVVVHADDGAPAALADALVLPHAHVELEHDREGESGAHGGVEAEHAARAEVEQALDVVVVDAQALDDEDDRGLVDLVDAAGRELADKRRVEVLEKDRLGDADDLRLHEVQDALQVDAGGDGELLLRAPAPERGGVQHGHVRLLRDVLAHAELPADGRPHDLVLAGARVDDGGDVLHEVRGGADVPQQREEGLLLRVVRHVRAVVGEVVDRAQAAELDVARAAGGHHEALEHFRGGDVHEGHAEHRLDDVLHVEGVPCGVREDHAAQEHLHARVLRQDVRLFARHLDQLDVSEERDPVADAREVVAVAAVELRPRVLVEVQRRALVVGQHLQERLQHRGAVRVLGHQDEDEVQGDGVQGVEVEDAAYLDVPEQRLLLHVQLQVALRVAMPIGAVVVYAHPDPRQVKVVDFDVEDLVHSYLTEHENTRVC